MNHCTDQLIYVLAVTFLCFLSHSLPYETCINRQFRSSVNPRSGRNNIPKLPKSSICDSANANMNAWI